MLAPYERCVVGSSRPPAHGEARTSADPSDAEGISAAATSRARLIAPSPRAARPLAWGVWPPAGSRPGRDGLRRLDRPRTPTPRRPERPARTDGDRRDLRGRTATRARRARPSARHHRPGRTLRLYSV